MSFSDGPPWNSTGRLLFYLSPMGPAAQDLAAHPAATLTACEAQLLPGGCAQADPEDPNCAKVSLTGPVQPVRPQGEVDAAREMLFERHPAMASWPGGHDFTV